MVKRIFFAVVIVVTCGFSANVFGQEPDTIKLDNPSFEDLPSAAHTPRLWFDCGFQGESSPDTHPNPNGTFGIDKEAFDGYTYLGMVVRDNNTWEAVGQRLKTPLIKDTTYSFSLSVCRAKAYKSKSQLTGRDDNYNQPIIIKIWGGDGFCTKLNILAESKPIKSNDWQKVGFVLKPKINLTYFLIEAFYKTPTLLPYNGNILIDNASAIVPILDKN